MRNGEVSYWWHALGGFPPRRASLPGPLEADVCIVGGGYTGLWTAYYLAERRPDARIVVLEAAFAGYGASGRNGGWVTSELPGSRAIYARGPGRAAGVRALEAELRSTVDEVGRVCEAESIDCDYVRGGRLTVATSPTQLARLRAGLAHLREWGDGDDVYTFLSRDETSERINVAGALGGLYAPASARVQPAALAAGLAAAAERRGVAIYEATPVTEILPAGSDDADGDGVSNLTEYLAGTDPLNPASAPTPPAFSITQVGTTATNIQLSCSSTTNWTYQLQSRASLDAATFWTNQGGAQSGTGGIIVFNGGNTAANRAKFYRVQAR